MSEKGMVDKNGMRGGAGLSAVLLLVGFVFQWRAMVPAIGAALAIGSLFGLRYSPLGATYRFVKKAFRLSIPVEPEAFAKLDSAADSAALRRCLGLLDDNQRRCLLLAFVDGFSHVDIAASLKAPLGSVKSWVRRGLIALKGCLQQ